MEELDLDSILLAHGGNLSSSEDDSTPSNNLHRRTVEEILNDSDNSSTTPQTLTILNNSNLEPLMFKTHISEASVLPSLFRSVKPNPKPGAAVAAAVAAVRHVPTMYTERIKSRKASESELAQKVETLEMLQDFETDSRCELKAANSINEKFEAREELLKNNENWNLVGSSSRSGIFVNTQEMQNEDEVEIESKDDAVIENQAVTEIGTQEANGIIDDEEDDRMSNQDLDKFSNYETENTDIQNVTMEAIITEVEDDSEKESSDTEDLYEGSGFVDEIDELLEERLEQVEKNGTEEKPPTLMKPLEQAEELEKKNASYGLHWEEGAAAQPMRLEGIRRGPPAVGYIQIDLDNTVTRTISSQLFRRDYGLPQVVAVHMNYIGIGASKGAVLVFPSKYSAYSVDHVDAKMLVFNSNGAKSQASVTSMCFNQQGDLLLVGYGDGSLTLWDVQKAAIAKVMNGEHSSPVVHALFLGQFTAITGDSKGIVFQHTISVFPLLNHFSVKSKILLDGKKNGTVLSIRPHIIDGSHSSSYNSAQVNSTQSTSGLGSMVGGVVGGVVNNETGWKLFNEGSSLAEEGVVIFATHKNLLVIRLTPTTAFYDTLSKPDGVREGSMPYIAWRCTTCSNDSSSDVSDKTTWLVNAWDHRVQVMQLVKSKLKIIKEWSLDSMAIGAAWLDDQMLVVLTAGGQLCLFSKDGSELHRTSFAVNGSSLDDIISYHTHINNTYGNPEKAYHNSVCVRGATIYLLGPMHLLTSRLLPWKEHIQVLQRAGDWMGALDMAMRLYDGQAQGVIDLPRSVEAIRETIMEYLVELLKSYVDEVFSYISVSFCNQIGKVEQSEDTILKDSSVRSEIEEQYARVGGVAVEFCVHIKRTDILFNNIYSKFESVEHGGTFLEILEPYVLKDMLGGLPPEIMQALVEHYSARGWLQRVEQCVLHMNIASLDFNQVVKLCREHSLFGALIYLFNKGLNDFRAPLEELLMVIQNSPSTDVSAIGYRMLVYLKYCFQGLAFPPGHGFLLPSQLPSVRKELLQFLLEESSNSVSSENFKILKSFHGNCPKLFYLLLLDTGATLDVLKYAFSEVHIANSTKEIGKENQFENSENQNSMAQDVVNVLTSILSLESDVIRTLRTEDNTEVWPSTNDVGLLLKFIAFLVACNGTKVSGKVFKHIVEHLTLINSAGNSHEGEEEKQLLALLKAVPQTERETSYVLRLCKDAHFYQACGFIHTVNGQYIAALDGYLSDVHEPIHAFAFISNMLLRLSGKELSSFRSAVLSRVPELVKLSRECTYILVIDKFKSESQTILTELHSHPESLFLFLKTAIEVYLSGTLNISSLDLIHVLDNPNGKCQVMSNEAESYPERLSTWKKNLRQNMIEVTSEIAELYLELLCKYERSSVLKFLETFDNYRLEYCLHLCQEYEVTDASAFLLERAGDVGSALGLVMTGLNEKIDMLVAAIEIKFPRISSSVSLKKDKFSNILKLKEVIDLHNVLKAAIGLCQRNTKRLNQHEAESLWFRLLDSFSNPLRRFYHGMMSPVNMSSTTSKGKFNESDFCSRLKVSNLRKRDYMLRRVFSKFVGEIIEGMVGYVPLPAIMAKLLSDNENQEFGDFKLTIMKMLGTYGYEKRILDTAKSLIEDDIYYTMGLLKKGATHAFVPQDTLCCICGCPLSKGTKTSGVRIFNCGHANHLHCESEESEVPSNHYYSNGCPICLTKKKLGGVTVSTSLDSGLVKSYTSSSGPVQGVSNVQHAHDLDVEKHYGLQQMSRFEILSNLQKSKKYLQTDILPQLKLSPPAVYNEKVQKGGSLLAGIDKNAVVKNEKSNKRGRPREFKSKSVLDRFPLKSSLFAGPEKKRL